MREIKQTAAFKRDLKREIKGQHRGFLSANFAQIIQALAKDEPLGAQHRDPALVGEWKDCRDCHVRPDLVLIFRKPDASTLQLVRLAFSSPLQTGRLVSPIAILRLSRSFGAGPSDAFRY